MSKEIRLTLQNKEGKEDNFIEKFIPAQKLIDLLELEIEMKDGKYDNVSGTIAKIDFVAGLFSDERVTTKSILKGLDAREVQSVTQDIINNVYGIVGTDEDAEGK